MTEEKPNLEEIALAEGLAAKLPEEDRKEFYHILLKAYASGLSYGGEMGRHMGCQHCSNASIVEKVQKQSNKVIAYLKEKAGKEVHIELYLR